MIDIKDPKSVAMSDYNSSRPTVLISHGFTPDFKILSGSNAVFGFISDGNQCIDLNYYIGITI